jgi:hypothetical protein
MMLMDILDVKQGDRVTSYYGRVYGDHYTLHIVARVTDSGQIVLDNGDRYTPDGRGIGPLKHRRIREIDDDVRDAIRRRELTAILRPHLDRWDQLPTETLGRIAEIVGARGGPEIGEG